jgi:hypothetical protein
MTKLLVLGALFVVLVAPADPAHAQADRGASGPAGPAGGAAAAPAGTGSPAIDAPAPAAAPDARKLCAAAMNADPRFAAEIVRVADEKAAKQRDDTTLAAHTDANARVQQNERHVIYAYAAMWLIAALFVIFLWRRQETLKAEIAGLRRDLEAAAGEEPTKAQS